ncbi:MAG: glycoside hydrolase family 88 protein [Bacteroidales bacterium]|nr:glycoside hydrolase family 88 protein [Bacteroidales bacterium]
MKKSLVLLLILSGITKTWCQPDISDEAIVRSIADRILAETQYGFTTRTGDRYYRTAQEIPEDTLVRFKSHYLYWHYVNGVINMAMIDLGEFLQEEKYTQHCINQIYFGFDNYQVFESRRTADMPRWGYPYRELFDIRELDDCGSMGASAIEAFHRKPSQELRDYFDRIADHILNKQDRLADKTLVRKGPHEMTLWADDLFMSVPFLARMGKLTGESKYFDDAISQVLNFHKYLWNEHKGLYYHCYYSNLDRNGVAHWGRCNGWVMMAEVHLLNLMPSDHPQREAVRKILEKHILGIAKYQNGKGLWHQLLDKNDSYEESSCTSMFVYAIARAVNMGWIDKNYGTIASAGWEGLKNHMITADGQLKNVCFGTGIQDNLVFYYNRPARTNELHGLGAVIEAGIEIMRMKDLAESVR